MADQSNPLEADDFLDKKTIVDRAIWLLHAGSRFLTAVVLGMVFLTGLAVLELRYRAEQAISPSSASAAPAGAARLIQADAMQTELHQLIAADAGLPVTQLSSASNLRQEAETAYDAKGALDAAVVEEADRRIRLDEAERRLTSAAEQAGCGVNPTVTIAQTCQATVQTQSLLENLTASRESYDKALNAAIASGVQVRALQVAHDEALRPPGAGPAAGAPLAPAVPTLREFDGLLAYMPEAARPAVSSFFAIDTEGGVLLMAFIAGLLGATCLLFILMAFPTYLPLTFGSGKHFFLRMVTGGVVAFLVVLLFRLGAYAQGAPAELTQAQNLLAQTSFSEPVRYALIGVIAGFFSEQIGSWAKNYVEAFSRNPAAAAASAPGAGGGAQIASQDFAEPAGAMGPGAAAEMRGS